MNNGNFNINTGGLVQVVHGLTGEVKNTRQYAEPAYQRKDREMTDRARNFYPNLRERELERSLMNQVAGTELLSATNAVCSPAFEFKFEQWQKQIMGNRSRVKELEAELFNQVANHERI